MTLDGLEAAIKGCVPGRIGQISTKVHVIRYTDDFIVTGISREILELKVMPVIVSFLQKRGLSLSKEKTRITHIEDGFNFLGQNIRKYNGKLLIKPARENVKAFLCNVRQTIRKHRGLKAEAMIGELNPKIRGWANYHRHVVSRSTFGYVDRCIFNSLWQWMKRRHRNKSKTWMRKKYWTSDSRAWVFYAKVKNKKGQIRLYKLIQTCSIGIVRHVKIRGVANPFDPEYKKYFERRKYNKTYGTDTCPV